MARIEYPDLDEARELARLDALAGARRAPPPGEAGRALERLQRFLFDEEGFRGNADEYYDPRNSCLNDVLDRKLGIPITLSVLTMEVGRRVGLDIVGVGLPGHFIVSAGRRRPLGAARPLPRRRRAHAAGGGRRRRAGGGPAGQDRGGALGAVHAGGRSSCACCATSRRSTRAAPTGTARSASSTGCC